MRPPVTGKAESSGWHGGFAAGLSFAPAVFALAVGFGTTAVTAGWPPWLAVLVSAGVFASGAQFALVLGLASGGGPLVALATATLVNLRFVPMALAAGPYFRGGRFRRSLQAQAVVDASWVAARRPDGRIDVSVMIGATLVQWPTWVAGTAIGALSMPDPGLTRSLGLDVVFPAFFLIFVLDAARASSTNRMVICVAGGIAVATNLVLPPAAALLCAGCAALLTLSASEQSA